MSHTIDYFKLSKKIAQLTTNNRLKNLKLEWETLRSIQLVNILKKDCWIFMEKTALINFAGNIVKYLK